MKNVFQLFLILAISLVANAQTKVWNVDSGKKSIAIVQWEVHDMVYKIKETIKNPYQQEAFALVESEAGEQKIPLFYNDNNEWVFRFSSTTVGSRKFKIKSNIKELDGKKGIFIISENKKKDRHGGIIRKKDNPRHFFYEDGSHYFNLAFECDWLFALDYGQKDMPKTDQLLDHIQNNGFNQVVMNVYAYGLDKNWVADERLQEHPEHNYGEREDIFPFWGSNSNPDYSALNVDFFKNFDRVISKLHDREIVSHLMIYVWNKRVAWPEPGSDADNMYYNYVIKRYQAFPNIIWDVSKEATSKIALSRYKNIAEHIRNRVIDTKNLDAYNRLVSVHAYGFCKNNRDIVDFISIQNWKLGIYDYMLEAYKDFPEMPVFNIEHGGYEKSPYNVFPGGYDNAEECLKRNYLCLFAGTYTTYYWQAAAWTAIIHNPFEQPENFVKPHFEYFKYMRKLFDKVNFEQLEPVTKYNARAYNLTDYNNGVILLYVPKEVYNDDVRDQLEEEFDFSEATKQWFNTLTGEFTDEEKVEYKNYYTIWDNRPFRDEADAVLLVRNLKPKN